MPPKPPLDSAQLQLLRDDLDLLHLLFHRNKNQHRLLKWWQWFGTLRRNLNKLLLEHDLITSARTTPNRGAAVEKFKARVVFLQNVVVPSAHRAFGSVVTMKNFAPLGMVLIGVLARTWKIIRPSQEELRAEREIATMALKVNADTDADLGVAVSRDAYSNRDGSVKEVGAVISRAEYADLVARRTAEVEQIHRVEDRGEASSMSGDAQQPSSRVYTEGKPRLLESEWVKLRLTSPVAVNNEKNVEEEMGQVKLALSERKSKRKPDAEPGKKRKKKKKKVDDIDDLFDGLF